MQMHVVMDMLIAMKMVQVHKVMRMRMMAKRLMYIEMVMVMKNDGGDADDGDDEHADYEDETRQEHYTYPGTSTSPPSLLSICPHWPSRAETLSQRHPQDSK